MTRSRRPSLGPAVLAVLLAATGCTGTAAVEQGGDDTGGPGLPAQIAGEDYGGEPVAVDGTLVLSQSGCFLLGIDGTAHVAVWPSDFGWGGDAVLDAAGERLEPGVELRGEGRFVPLDDFPGGPDGYWASTLGFCDVGTDVVVLDRVEPAP